MVLLHGEPLFGERGYHIAETVLETPFRTFLHTHDFCEIFLITEGEVYQYINGKEQLIQKNKLCFVRPEDVHQFCLGACRRARFLNLAFAPEDLKRARTITQTYFPLDFPIPEPGEGAELPEQLAESIHDKLIWLSDEWASVPAVQRKSMLLNFLVDCHLLQQTRTEETRKIPGWLWQACEAMRREENFSLGLERLIELSGKSQEHVTRTMKQCYGITPTAWINRIRLEKVCTLLKTTREPILEIMLRCGFNNVSYFNLLFKKKYGLSPMKYRNLNRVVIDPAGISLPQENEKRPESP